MDEIEFKLSLIKYVEQNKCLYDKSDAFYYNRLKRENTWVNIAKNLNTTVVNCKMKWKNLRENFYKKIVKSDTESPVGEAFEEWPYLNALSFLKENIRFYSRSSRRPEKNLVEVELPAYDTDASEEPKAKRACESATISEQNDEASIEWKILTDEEMNFQLHSETQEPTKSEHDVLDCLKETNQTDVHMKFNILCSKFSKTMEKLETTLYEINNTVESTKDSEDVIFMQSVLSLMKMLPEDTKDQFQCNMYNELYKLRAQVRSKRE